MPTIVAEELQQFAADLLAAGGATAEEANCVAASLVASNLRGYESHGVMRVPFYVRAVADGTVVSGAELTVLQESPTHLACDGNWGFGQLQAARLLTRLSTKAQQSGMAVGTMLHTGHIGRLGEYCETSAEQGLVSMLMVNSQGAVVRVAPPGGKAPRLSTNPLAIGVPESDGHLVLDFSTSATAEGKVRVKHIAGQQCPEGWLLDSDGQTTTDPGVLYGEPPGSIRPMGGEQSYKGFGLGLMIEILAGALSGGRTAREPLYAKKGGNCVFMMLVNPEAFGGRAHFAEEVSQLASYVRGCPRVDGVDQIFLPGDPERAVLAQRSQHGIPLDDENWAQLEQLAEQLDVPVRIES